MSRVLLRQLSLLLITLFLLTVLSFSLSYWFPGNAITNASGISPDHPQFTQIAAARGFSDTLFEQYIAYLRHLFSGDWGVSLQDGSEVWSEFKVRFPATLELAVLAMGLALLLGPPLGFLAALNYRRPVDHIITAVSLSGYSIPVFWLAQVSILIFAIVLDWVPIAGQINPLFDIVPVTGSIFIDIALSDTPHKAAAFENALQHVVLPVAVLASMPLVLLIRLTRTAAIDVLKQKFIKGAYARGLSTGQVLVRHTMPNAMQSVSRQIGNAFSLLITNVLITELIFSWPGLGNWLVRSIYERDYPVIQGGLLILASLILIVNVLMNLFHAWRYPQVRQEFYAS